MARGSARGAGDVGLATPVTGRAAPDEGVTREERKARTHRALLDAALEISAEHGFAGTSLRAVTKAAGIVPTAFYRHYASMDALGETLVEESFSTLRRMMRAIRSEGIQPGALIEGSVDVLADWVGSHEAHFQFIARERSGGSAVIRASVQRQLRVFVSDLSADLLVFPPLRDWRERDRYLLAEVIVNQVVATTERLIDATDPRETVLADSGRQLRMVVAGLEHWRSQP
ncbi:TetR family transcriptional regulator [Rhodococcus aerolatus]